MLQDRTIAANCCPQTPDEMNISESILSDQLEMTSSDLKDSSSPTEEELSVCEMVFIGFIRVQEVVNTYDNFV